MIYEMLEHGHNVESIYRDDSLPVRAAPSSISLGRRKIRTSVYISLVEFTRHLYALLNHDAVSMCVDGDR